MPIVPLSNHNEFLSYVVLSPVTYLMFSLLDRKLNFNCDYEIIKILQFLIIEIY